MKTFNAIIINAGQGSWSLSKKLAGKILGASIVGQEWGEIMSLLQMAMAGSITYKHLANLIFAHPLCAEALNNLFIHLDLDLYKRNKWNSKNIKLNAVKLT